MAVDDDQTFRVLARRNYLFGRWVAGRLGHEGEAATSYAYRYVNHGMDEDDAELVEYARLAIAEQRGAESRREILARLHECGERAAAEIGGDRAAARGSRPES